MLIIKKKQSNSNQLPKPIRGKSQIQKAFKAYAQNVTNCSNTTSLTGNNQVQTSNLQSLNQRLLQEAIESKVNDLIEIKHNIFYRVIKMVPIYGYRNGDNNREIIKVHLEAGKLIVKYAVATVEELEDCGFTMQEFIEHIVEKGGKIVKPDFKFLESL